MKKVILIACLLFGVNLYADLLEDGLQEHEKGNYKKATELFGKACDGGNMSACYNSGLMYDNGDGVRQDKVKAKELYTKACDGGYMGACYNLGVMHDNGDGVRQDKVKAKELFGKACDGGYMNGCKNYKILNEAGIQ